MMRMILGLGHPTSGTATIDGKAYRQLTDPLRTVGALLDARQAHPNRSARNHLRWIAATNRIAKKRVNEVLEMVGLTSVARSKSSTGGSPSSAPAIPSRWLLAGSWRR